MSDSGSEEDVPLGQLGTNQASAAATAEGESSEEDVPLGQLCGVKAATNGSKKRAVPTKSEKGASKKAKPSPKPAARSKSSSSSSSSSSRAAAAPPRGKNKGNETDDFYNDSLKGALLQRLICRWWYAIEWPAQEDIDKPAPPHYMPLDGFPGVHVCVEGDGVGTILDNRDPSTCPSFSNLKAKPCEELKRLLIQALEAQRQQLIEHEGEQAAGLKELNADIRWANSFNVGKAEKEARRLGY